MYNHEITYNPQQSLSWKAMHTTSSEPHDEIKAHVSVIFALVNVCMYVLSFQSSRQTDSVIDYWPLKNKWM